MKNYSIVRTIVKRMSVCVVVSTLAVLPIARATSHYKINQEFYSRAAEVVSIDNAFGTVTAADEKGNLWSFCGEGFRVGDSCKLMMYGNGTPEITDDEVVFAE